MSVVAIFLVTIPLLVIVAVMLTDKGSRVKEFFRFAMTGLDSGFTLSQIIMLGRIGKTVGLKDLTSLFWSVGALDSCISQIVQMTKSVGTENERGNQRVLTQLYDYRTKIELDQSQKKHGLDSTRDIAVGQRVRLLLRGTGLFSSKVVRNGPKNLVIEYPIGTRVSGSSVDWLNKKISVYFWRHDDAGYVFDTAVTPDPTGTNNSVLNLSHSYMLIRSQKRRSIRAKCSIYAQLYLVRPGDPVDNALEPEPGMKCLLEDLSEDGAMILIGGKAEKDMRIKLQFMIHDVLIVMNGSIKAVDYNKESNQSRIHFESNELNPRMRNAILTFVYNVLPQSDKEELDAIRLSEEDSLLEAESAEQSLSDTHADNDGAQAAGDSDIGELESMPELPDFADKKD